MSEPIVKTLAFFTLDDDLPTKGYSVLVYATNGTYYHCYVMASGDIVTYDTGAVIEVENVERWAYLTRL